MITGNLCQGSPTSGSGWQVRLLVIPMFSLPAPFGKTGQFGLEKQRQALAHVRFRDYPHLLPPYYKFGVNPLNEINQFYIARVYMFRWVLMTIRFKRWVPTNLRCIMWNPKTGLYQLSVKHVSRPSIGHGYCTYIDSFSE